MLVPLILAGGAGLIVPIVTGFALFAASNALAPALMYMLTAEDKRPGDTGGGFPGFITPNHPTPAGGKQARTRRRAELVPVMAY